MFVPNASLSSSLSCASPVFKALAADRLADMGSVVMALVSIPLEASIALILFQAESMFLALASCLSSAAFDSPNSVK